MVRLGWSTAKGDLQGPVGYDLYSYSYRSVTGQKFWRARGKPYGESYGPGDTIGCMIKITDTIVEKILEQDLPKIRKKKNEKWAKEVTIFSKKTDESQPQEIMVGSEIIFFKNGEDQNTAFVDIIKGEYYPAVSLFGGAECTLNFGPKFGLPVSWKHKYHNSVLPVVAVVPSEHPKPKDPSPSKPSTEPPLRAKQPSIVPPNPEPEITNQPITESTERKIFAEVIPPKNESPSKFSHLLNPCPSSDVPSTNQPMPQLDTNVTQEKKSFKLEAILAPLE